MSNKDIMQDIVADVHKIIANLDDAVSQGHWEEAETLCRDIADEAEDGARYASILHDEYMESKT